MIQSSLLFFCVTVVLFAHELFFFFRFPFDTKTPAGYVASIFAQSVEAYVVLCIWLCAVWFPVAHCVFIIAFCSDLKNEVLILNQSIKIECEKNMFLSRNAIDEIKEKLFKIILFHCDAKKLSEYKFSIKQYFL